MAQVPVREKVFSTIEGIIIYPSAETLPTDIIFIPAKIDITKTLKENLLICLSNLTDTSHLVFFRPIKWIERDIEEQIARCPYEAAMITNFYEKNASVRMIVARITFNLTWVDKLQPLKSISTYSCTLTWDRMNILIFIKDAPIELSVPYYFDGDIRLQK
jgi:hypothetical protein